MTAAHARHTPISAPDLRDVLSGRVIAPGDAAYEQARIVFSGGIDRRPVVIVRPTDTSDVSQVVAIARERGWSWRSAAAATASPGTAPPTAGS